MRDMLRSALSVFEAGIYEKIIHTDLNFRGIKLRRHFVLFVDSFARENYADESDSAGLKSKSDEPNKHA